MNGSAAVVRTSRAAIQRVGWKPFTSPAMRLGNLLASNRVMGAMPERPARSAYQVSSVPMPTGVTRPTPVTTTLRRIGMAKRGYTFTRPLT